MVRDNRVSLGFDDDEFKELKERAKETHLKVGDYIRWYMFKPMETISIQHQAALPNAAVIPFKASAEVIERIKAGSPVYVDPYQEAKEKAQAMFSQSGGLGQLHNAIKLKSKGAKVLKPPNKKKMKEINKAREERKVVANKHIPKIKEKNIEAGYLDDKEPIILELEKEE